MGVIINTLNIANNYNKDSIDDSCSIGISPIEKIYNLKAKKLYRQGIGTNSSSKYRKTYNGVTYYLQQIGIVVVDEDCVEAINSMDVYRNRIVIIRNSKTNKIIFSGVLGGFHVSKRVNGYATEYHLVVKSLSQFFFGNEEDLYYSNSFDFCVYEILDTNKKQTLLSVEKEVEVESYGSYNTVYNSSVKNIVNLQDCKIMDSEWNDMNDLAIGLDGNFIMYPYCVFGYNDFFPHQSKNEVQYDATTVDESEIALVDDISTHITQEDEIDFAYYEKYFNLLIPKSRKITKKAGLYVLNLSGEYI